MYEGRRLLAVRDDHDDIPLWACGSRSNGNPVTAADFLDSACKARKFYGTMGRACCTSWARIQGFNANMHHFYYSAANALPDDYRPNLFDEEGNLKMFPKADPAALVVGVRMFSMGGALRKVFVGGLARTVTEGELAQYMTGFGEVVDVYVVLSPTGVSRGFAYVTFATKEGASNCLAFQSHSLHGSNFGVKAYEGSQAHRRFSQNSSTASSLNKTPSGVMLTPTVVAPLATP
jgi:hypothetical protein